MTAEAALLLFLIKNLKASPEWTPKVKKQKAKKCYVFEVEFHDCWILLSWCFCACFRVLHQAGMEGISEAVEIVEVSPGQRTHQGLEVEADPTSTVGLVLDLSGAGSESFPFRTHVRS